MRRQNTALGELAGIVMSFETDKELLKALDRAAAEIETLDPEGADRLRHYLQCAALGIDPLLARVSPLLHAQEVVERMTLARVDGDDEDLPPLH